MTLICCDREWLEQREDEHNEFGGSSYMHPSGDGSRKEGAEDTWCVENRVVAQKEGLAE